jgi:hypothetical protein
MNEDDRRPRAYNIINVIPPLFIEFGICWPGFDLDGPFLDQTFRFRHF